MSIARICATSLCFLLSLFAAFKAAAHRLIGNPSRSSNPGPPAPLGPAPAPRAPRGLPPLSALPLTPAPPGSLCSGSVAGTGDVATQRGAAWKIHVVSSCEPPSDQPQEACLAPQQERRRCLGGGGGLAPAVHAPPPLSMRDLTRGKAKAPRAPSVAFRIVQGSVPPIWPCVCFNGREHRSRGRPVSAAHAASPGASLRSRSRRRAHQTANGSRRHGCEA